MLPDRLLSYQRTDEGRILPRWLSPRDEVWLRELAAEASASGGRPAGEADTRIVESVARRARAHGIGRRVVEGVWLVERRRWRTTVDSPVPPERIRRVLFDLAAERPRDEALATAAVELGLAEDELLDKLFADRRDARTLVAPDAHANATDLVERYNLVLAQSLLVRSTEVVAVARAHVKRVVAHAKLLRLMIVFDEPPDGGTRLSLSGPLALFHDTLKYGRALAAWFPSLVATPEWQLESRLVIAGERLRLELDPTAPIPRTHALPRAADSKLEAALERDLRRLGSPWRIERESSVIRAEGHLFFPDFQVVSERGSVLVEIVGFWTPEYLASKARMLRAARALTHHRFLMCVDERNSHGELAPAGDVLPFRGRIDARALVAACERALAPASSAGVASAAPVPPERSPAPLVGSNAEPCHRAQPTQRRHYLIVPSTAAYEHHAVRAGARRERWREDLIDDLTAEHLLRVVVGDDRVARGRVGLVGRRFLVEVDCDRTHADAFFVFRIMPAPDHVGGHVRTIAADLVIRAPGAPAAPTGAPVAAIVALAGGQGISPAQERWAPQSRSVAAAGSVPLAHRHPCTNMK